MTDSTSVSQQRPGLHRLAIAAAALCLLSVLAGAIVTGSGATPGGPDFRQLHQIVAGVASVVIAILALWMIVKQPAPFGYAMLATLLAEGGIGSFQGNSGVAILHACLGQVLLALTVAAAVLTGPAWSQDREIVEDHGWPSLGSLGNITPIFVLGQIALGAAFRHKAMGVMPHLIGAMFIVILILCICIFVMQQFPAHNALRPSANTLMAVAFTQIFLGIAAFTVRTMTNIAAPVLIGVTSAHAAVGALTLAVAVVLHLQIRRNVRPHREEEE